MSQRLSRVMVAVCVGIASNYAVAEDMPATTTDQIVPGMAIPGLSVQAPSENKNVVVPLKAMEKDPSVSLGVTESKTELAQSKTGVTASNVNMLQAGGTNKSQSKSEEKQQKAQKKTQHKKLDNSLFRTEPGPPPGFAAAALEEKQTTIVSIYYDKKFIGNVTATFSSKEIKFYHPDEIIQQLELSSKKGVKETVLKALSGELSTHSENLCQEGETESYCKAIEPKIAGVIFDPNNFRATLFINPQYLPSAQEREEMPLPPSTVGGSYMAQNQLFVNATNNDQTFSLNNNSVFGYRDNRINVVSNSVYQHQSPTVNGENSPGQPDFQVDFSQISFTHIHNRSAWQAGMIYSPNGDYITQQNILGLTYTNHSQEVAQFVQSNRMGSPLVVHLTLPSRVTVLKDGNILDVEQLSAGNHILDTSGFPNGTYQVTIKITNNLGQTTTQTRFYTKQTELAPVGHPYYTLGAGILENTNQDNITQTVVIPDYKAIPLLSGNISYSFNYHWGVNATMMSDVSRTFFDVYVPYYGQDYQIGPSVIFSTSGDSGIGTVGQYQTDWGLSANLSALKMFSSSGQISPGDNTDSGNNLTTDNFNPFPTSDFLVQTGLNYGFSRFSLGVNGSWTKNNNEATVSSYGTTLTANLFNFDNTNGSFNLSFSQTSDAGYMLTAGISIGFNTASWSANVTGGYTQQTVGEDSTNDISGTNETTITYSGSLSHSLNWDNSKRSLRLGASFNQQSPTTRYYDGTMNYQGPYIASQMTVTHYLPSGLASADNEDSTTLVGQIDNTMGLAGFHISSGYSNGGYVTGAIVRVNSPENTAVKIFSNGNHVATVATGHNRMVFLQPYHTYAFTILPVGGKTFLKYDPNPKTITVYKGNVKYLAWNLAREFILFGNITWPNGKPVKNALLDNSKVFDSTDAQGFLQANLTSNDKVLRFTTITKKHCKVILPAKIYTTKKAYVEAGTLTCEPYTPKETKASKK